MRQPRKSTLTIAAQAAGLVASIRPVKLGFSSGEVSGSFWVAAAAIAPAPLLIKLAMLVWPKVREAFR
jgi:hypothetical protein